MTDEEFERLKAAEKEHLRKKKRLQSQLKALKTQQRGQRVVQKMKRGAERLLEETESLVESLRRSLATQEARLEGALDEAGTAADDDLREYEEQRREERAESLLRRYKAARSSAGASHAEPAGETSSADEDTEEAPEKTIGRMRTPRSDDTD